MKNEPTRLQLISACLGNLFEHYDTALFGFLSPFLAPLIFPEQDPLAGLILTYTIIPLGMIIRPIGSLVFGYIGDRYGRETALFGTLIGMAIVSGCIAFSPTYQQVGWAVSLFFLIGRILQNFFSSGETMGAAIFLLENTPEKRHDYYSGIYNASTIGGILLASLGVAVIVHLDMIHLGWRVLYLLGCVTALFGILVRSHIKNRQSKPITLSLNTPQYKKTFLKYWKELLLIAIGSGFSYANYTMALVLMNGFIPFITDFSKAEMANLNSLLLILDFCMLPLFGWLSSKISRERMMLGATLAVVFGAIPLMMICKGGSLLAVIGVRCCFVLFGVAYCAPFHAWALQLIPKEHRYTIISFGHAIGSQLFGGPTSAISLWMFKNTGMVESVAWYWMAIAILNGVVLIKSMGIMDLRKEWVGSEDR